MNPYVEQLHAVAGAAQPHSADRFMWFGQLTAGVDPRLRDLILARPDVARNHLLASLTHRLYRDFYQPGAARPTPPPPPGSPRGDASRSFVEEIARANRGSGQQQEGWTVTAISSQGPAVERDGTLLRADFEDLGVERDDPLEVGQRVSLGLPNQLAAFSPGFVTILSDQPFTESGPVVRIYWNFHYWGIPAFVTSITGGLNERRIPFTLKIVNHPDGYSRCDSAVLRLHAANVGQALPVLRETYWDVSRDLKHPVPALTRCIAPGTGMTEEPTGGMSFGLHRCALIAGALIAAWEQGFLSQDELTRSVAGRMERDGIDPEKPYLNPGAGGEHNLSLTFSGWEVSRSDSPGTGDSFLEVARSIGDELEKTAIWHEDRCNWIGIHSRDVNAPAHHGMTWSTLGPDLYDGTSGVALFLAELAVTEGNDRLRDTALGAIRHALSRSGSIDPRLGAGLYSGVPGLCLAAPRVGSLLDEPQIVDAARARCSRILALSTAATEFDLLNGRAGAIIALLSRHDRPAIDDALVVAAAIGEQLVAAAQPLNGGLTWRSPALSGVYPLTGLSHGAAGIGVALLELWHANGGERYREVAEQAFSFEQHWFDEKQHNWPDFRNTIVRDGQPAPPFQFKTHWCHGAPGIALSRLRAWQLTGDSHYQREAIVALQTTEAAILQALHDGTANYSLCHGLAGNAEVLLRGYHALGSEFECFRTTALQVAGEDMRLYAAPEREWPCGTHGGWTPGLMLGLAGIGRFYLYLANPSLPCVLLPGLS